MDNLNPSYFFDLTMYLHKALFDQCEYVWEALGNISSYLKKQKLGQIEPIIPTGAYLVNPEQISIGKGTVIEPGAYIKGPCIIGENCVIRHGAYIRGDVIVGNRCVIGHDTEVKNAILLDDAHAAHFAYLGDTILGNKTNLGAGTKCANLKLDNGPVFFHYQNKKIPTGLRKFGAILGDETQIGCNAVTNPGTACGKGVRWFPCVNHGGFIPAHHIVKSDAKILVTPLE